MYLCIIIIIMMMIIIIIYIYICIYFFFGGGWAGGLQKVLEVLGSLQKVNSEVSCLQIAVRSGRGS